MVRAASATLTVLLARVYGPSQYGAYSTALGLANLAVLFPDFGISLLIARDGARAHDQIPLLMRAGITAKTLLSLCAIVLLAVVAVALGYPRLTLSLIVIVGIGTLVGNYSTTFYAGHLALEQNDRAGVVTATVGVASLVGAAVAILLGNSIVVAALYSTLGSGAAVALSGRGWFKSFEGFVSWTELRSIMSKAAPFAIGSILYYVYFRIDVVMLSVWRSPEEVGWYNAAYRLVAVLYFIPGSVCAALFSRLSRLATVDPLEHRTYIAQMVRIMGSVGLLVSTVLIMGSSSIVTGLFGQDFSQSAPLLGVLGWFLLLQCVSFPLGDGLSTTDRQTGRLWVMGAAAALNVLLNVLWIPSRGATGAAVATLVTEAFVAAGYWVLLSRPNVDRRLLIALGPAIIGAGAVIATRYALADSGASLGVKVLLTLAAATVAMVIGNWGADKLGLKLRTPGNITAATPT